MKRLSLISISVALFLILLLTLGACNVGAVNGENTRYNYLICGFDDASDNTDVIIIASLDTESQRLDFVQIPRDTAYSGEVGFYKINGIYPKKIAQGKSGDEALGYLRDELAEIFGIKFNGYFGLGTDNLREIVDILGGIEVYVPENVDGALLSTLGLKRGLNLLDGEEALRLVRHRKSYITGDLGRIDAQKLVISALIKRLHSGFDFGSALDMIIRLDGVASDFRVRDILKILGKSRGSLENFNLSFSTLPGEAAADKSGIWYYVANKVSGGKLLFELGVSDTEDFDPRGRLMPRGSGELMKLYNKPELRYNIYYNNDILSINFNTKK